MKKNQKGFSLIEMAISTTILAVVTIGTISLTKNTQKTQIDGLSSIKYLEVHQVIMSSLLNKGSCVNTFVGQNLKIGDDIPNIKDNNGNNIYAVNGIYSSDTTKILSMKTEDKGQVNSDGTRNVDLVLTTQKIKTSSSLSTKTDRIQLRLNATSATSLITNCFDSNNSIIRSAIAEACTNSSGAWNADGTLTCTYPQFVKKSGDTMTGNLTAPQFIGNFSGIVTGNLTGNFEGMFSGNANGDFIGDITSAATITVQSNLTANGGFKVNNYCNSLGGNCKTPASLVEAQACAPNQYLNGISATGVPSCLNIPSTACGPNSFISKKNADGSMVCSPLPNIVDFACSSANRGEYVQDLVSGVPTCVSRSNMWEPDPKGITNGFGRTGIPDSTIGSHRFEMKNTTTESKLSEFYANLEGNGASNATWTGGYFQAVVNAPTNDIKATAANFINDMTGSTKNTISDSSSGLNININALGSVPTVTGLYSYVKSSIENGTNLITQNNLLINTNGSGSELTDTNASLVGLMIDLHDGMTATNRYGIHFLAPAGTPTITNNFTIYQAGPTQINHLDGKVGLGIYHPNAALDVSGDIYATGCMRSSAGVAGGICVSDEQIKENILPFTPGLSALLNLDPKNFYYNGKGETEKSQNKETGFIAQEVEKYLPQLVSTKKIKLNPTDQSLTEIKQVNYTAIPYLSINAIKDLYQLFSDKFSKSALILSNIENDITQNHNLLSEIEKQQHQAETRNLALEKFLCSQGAGGPQCKK